MCRNGVRFLLFLLIFSLAVGCVSCREPPSREVLTVSVFDVGQSDCVLLTCSGQTMLIDTGDITAADAVRNELRAHGVTRVDTLILSHPHDDHYGNVRLVLEEFEVGEWQMPDIPCEELGFTLALDAAEKQDVPIVRIREETHFSLGGASVSLLPSPVSDTDNLNDTSMVVRVAYGKNVFLFMGDAEADEETLLLREYSAAYFNCDFIKIGHHGSKTSNEATFLAAASPTVAAISCGRNNEYGFPHRETLAALARIGATVACTDTEGTLEWESDGESVRRKDKWKN